jgi:hypothetical protein
VSVRDADFVPIGDVRTEVFTTNFPDDAFNANGACIGRYVERQDPGFAACEIDHGDRLTDGDDGNAFWPGVGLERGNQLVIVCSGPAPTNPAGVTASDTYQFMAGTRGSDTDYTIYAWSSSIGDEATADDLFKSVPANVLTELTEAEKFVVTGEGSGEADADTGAHPGLHFKMGQTVTFTVQLLDEDGDPVGPTPGENNLFEVKVDTFRETASAETAQTDAGDPVVDNSPSEWLTGEVYENTLLPPDREADPPEPTDPLNVHGRDDVVDVIASFPTGDADLDFTRTRAFREPDSSGQFTVTVSYRDPTRLINNADALVQVTIEPAPGNGLEATPMQEKITLPMDEARVTGDSVQLPDVRFSDNDPLVTSIEVSGAAYRIRSLLRNRNSISASVLDQYGALYRAGGHEIVATDVDHDALPVADPPTEGNDFPDAFAVSRSGRRSLGYTHTGTSPERQDVTLELRIPELRIPRVAAADTDDLDTPYVNEANLARADDPNTGDDEARSGTDDPDTLVNEANVAIEDDETTDVNEARLAMLLADVVPTPVTVIPDPFTVYWASVAVGPFATGQNTVGLEILIGDPGANFIVVTNTTPVPDPDSNSDTEDAMATPVAYPYGADDNFVVEGASVTMDQFEEILAQHDPTFENGGLIESLGMLSWAGYDFSRPRDGATWTITGLLCREPPSGD